MGRSLHCTSGRPHPRRVMTKVLVSDPIDQTGIDILSQVAQVDVRTGLPPEQLKQIIGEYDALMKIGRAHV